MTSPTLGLVFDVPDITLRRHFGKALEAVGIEDFRWHCLL